MATHCVSLLNGRHNSVFIQSNIPQVFTHSRNETVSKHKKTSAKMNIPFLNQVEFTIWTIFSFHILNPHLHLI